MPRLSRIDAPGLFQHVIARGIEQRPIFIDDNDRHDFIRRMAKLLPETDTRCFAWALLTNHFHLLLRTQNQPLATFMRRLLTGYAVYFNRRYNRSGHLYQNRYKSIVCEKETYFLELVRYIHLNPLRAGIVKNLHELDIYPWSGHAALIGSVENHWQDCNEVLTFFNYIVADYKLFISEGTELGDLSNNKKVPLTKKLVECSGPAFGSSEFSESFKQSEKTSHRPGVNSEEVFPVIVKKALQYYGIGEESIFSGLKSSAVSECRAIIAYFAQERLGMPGSSIAENLGLCRSAVSRLVQRGRKIADREISLIGRLNDYNL
ncbi:MAG: transposase [Desulfocucumaceae bacterium]